MIPLQTQLDEDFKNAMKARDEAAVSTLRLLKAALKNKQIDAMRDLTEEEIFAVIKSEIKKLKDGLVSFEAGGREDLAAPARHEIATLEKYLPAQMVPEEVERVVKESLVAAGITSKEDMGRAMGIAMKAVAGKADGTAVREIVAKLLV